MNMKNYYKIKKNIFNYNFKNTNKLVEDKKKFVESDPDTIIKNNKKIIISKN